MTPDFEKRCTNCHKIFPATLGYFHKDKSGKNGLKSQCKQCCNNKRKVKRDNGYRSPGSC